MLIRSGDDDQETTMSRSALQVCPRSSSAGPAGNADDRLACGIILVEGHRLSLAEHAGT
jgi:Cu/Zn superoxide dismutase